MNKEQPSKPKTRHARMAPVYGIIAVLLAWGALLAIGAIRRQQIFDWRKPTIIAASVGLFVAFWIVLLLMRSKNNRQ